jgi:hypothetical protein
LIKCKGCNRVIALQLKDLFSGHDIKPVKSGFWLGFSGKKHLNGYCASCTRKRIARFKARELVEFEQNKKNVKSRCRSKPTTELLPLRP